MAYVEWLRVWRCLKVTAIVLAALLALAGIVRLYLLANGHESSLTYVYGLENDPSSRVTHSTLPDGTVETTIDNPRKGVHVVLDDRGARGKRIRIVEPSTSRRNRAHTFIDLSSDNTDSNDRGKNTVTTIEIGGSTPLGFVFAAAVVVALVVATILGAPFARENDGHLEIAWTKPIGRERLALGTIAADLAGIYAAWLLAFVCCVLAHLMFGVPHYTFGSFDAMGLAVVLAGSAAWYGLLCAATTSLRRGYGPVIGFAWPVALIVAGLGRANLGTSQLAQIVHAIVAPLAWIDPLTYLHFGSSQPADAATAPAQFAVSSLGPHAAILAILAIVYLALAILQWRRVEA